MSKTIPKNNSKARKGVIRKHKGSHAESGRLEGGYEVSPHGPHRPSVAGCGLADADLRMRTSIERTHAGSPHVQEWDGCGGDVEMRDAER